MKKVFADTHYWVAITRPKDQWQLAAVEARNSLRNVVLVTTDEVLSEFMSALCGPADMRQTASTVVRSVMRNSNIRVIPQTRDGFLRALNRFERRRDKQYSLVDCHSMNVMEAEGIQDVLSNDHHFAQDGFTVLNQRSS